MKATEYKAIRKSGVSEFAIYPIDVASKLPASIEYANQTQNVRACPTGLIRATILQDNVKWEEGFSLGCGDTEYQRTRLNGVLVQVSLETLQAATKATIASLKKAPRTQIVQKTSERYVNMVVSKGAIMAPWGEYALIEAEREKHRAEAAEREERLDAAVRALGARKGHFNEVSGGWNGKKEAYDPPKEFDYKTSVLRRNGSHPQIVYLAGSVTLSLARAEEIAKELEKLRGRPRGQS